MLESHKNVLIIIKGRSVKESLQTLILRLFSKVKNLFLSDVNNEAEKPNHYISYGEGYKKPTCDIKTETKMVRVGGGGSELKITLKVILTSSHYTPAII